MLNLVTQEAPLGCSIAVVASLLNISYKEAMKLFPQAKRRHGTTGFYNQDIISALSQFGLDYRAIKRRDKSKIKPKTIVFLSRSKKFPFGHYLLKTNEGYLNSWINYPCITPAQSGLIYKLPRKIKWVLEEGRKSLL